MRLLEMLDTIARTQPTQMIYVSHRSDELPEATTHELHLALGASHRIIVR
jgi:ABC-type molybdenum transport system ATPase subunit/photorepair protein PhrA